MLEQSVMSLLKELVSAGKLDAQSLAVLIGDRLNDPWELHNWFYQWYRGLGIETITGKPFELSECPFTQQEIQRARERNEIILCVPKGVSKQQLGELFRIRSWAFSDPLIGETTEQADFWFRTSATMKPDRIRSTGISIAHSIDKEGWVHFTLERYLVFLAAMKAQHGQYPDREYWIWITKGRYDRSGMLMAGIDRLGHFNAHGWMPQFEAGFLGARHGELPEKR